MDDDIDASVSMDDVQNQVGGGCLWVRAYMSGGGVSAGAVSKELVRCMTCRQRALSVLPHISTEHMLLVNSPRRLQATQACPYHIRHMHTPMPMSLSIITIIVIMPTVILPPAAHIP